MNSANGGDEIHDFEQRIRREPLKMTREAFKSIKVGDMVATRFGARTRKVTYIYDDPSGVHIISLSAIQGCTASVSNLTTQSGPNDYHYSGSAVR
jgi:hypothetical protein